MKYPDTDSIQRPDPADLESILAGLMTMEDAIKEVAVGAKQSKRDTYKWNALQTVLAWQGIKPADKAELEVSGPLIITWEPPDVPVKK